tara:strand:+ start:739 stop:930 length:192 start_codon:yes stop_codon:yes gene_type:complete
MEWQDKDDVLQEEFIKNDMFATKMQCATEIFTSLISLETYNAETAIRDTCIAIKKISKECTSK